MSSPIRERRGRDGFRTNHVIYYFCFGFQREIITPQVKPYIMKAVREAEPQIRKGIYETDIASSLDGVKKSIEVLLEPCHFIMLFFIFYFSFQN